MLTQDPPLEGGHLVFGAIFGAAKRITIIIINLVGVGGCTPRRPFWGVKKSDARHAKRGGATRKKGCGGWRAGDTRKKRREGVGAGYFTPPLF